MIIVPNNIFLSLRFLCLIVCVIFSSFLFAQTSITKLFFSSFEDITKLNFDNTPPTVEYTGITDGFEAIAHVEDASGNIIFYVNANGVYRSDNVQMPGSVGLFANSSSAEINVCSIPGEIDRYYVLYNAETCSPIYYSIVDMSLDGGQGDVSELNVLIDNENYGEGLEIVRIPNTENYWFLTHQCDVGIRVFEINNTGIQVGTLSIPLSYGAYDVRGEMDYHNGKVAMADAYMGKVVVFDFDPFTGGASNLLELDHWGAYGVEFSPDATKVYYTDWSAFTDNLYQLDLSTSTLTPYTLDNWAGQIEMGPDGRLYINSPTSSEIGVIENPDDLAINISYISTENMLSLGVSDHIQSDVLFKAMSLSVTSSPATCYDATDGSAEVIVETGEAPFEYLWNDPDAQTTAIAEGLSIGSYTVTVTDFLGNSANATIEIDSPEELLINQEFPYSPLCVGDSTGGAVIEAIGGTPPYVEGWFGENPQELPSGTYAYQITDANGCSVIGEVEVLEPDILIISETHSDYTGYGVSCNGGNDGSIDITVNGGAGNYTYVWSNGSITEDISNLEPGIYSVVATDENGCFIDISVEITEPEPLQINDSFNNSDCGLSNGNINVTVVGGVFPYSYSWSNGGTTENVSFLDTGSYDLIVTDANGCNLEFSQDILNIETPPLVSGLHVYDCELSSYLSATTLDNNPGSWEYNGIYSDDILFDDPSSLTTLVTVPEYGTYAFQYNACDTFNTVLVTFSCPVIIPNVLTLNGDANNDFFIIQNLNSSLYSQSILTIYNRWGSIIYSQAGYGINEEWWDGKTTYNNIQLNDGVYYYSLELFYKGSQLKDHHTGYLNIIR